MRSASAQSGWSRPTASAADVTSCRKGNRPDCAEVGRKGGVRMVRGDVLLEGRGCRGVWCLVRGSVGKSVNVK